jgi:rhodanese-related sulfurtransferase
MTTEPRNPEPLRLRDVAALVLVGVALGVLYNAVQRSESPERSLAWVQAKRRVVSLGTGAPPADSLAPGGATTAGAPPAAAPAAAPPAAAPVRQAQPKAAPATPPAHAPAPAEPAAADRPVAATAAVPDVPESREPREVGTDAARAFHDAGAAVFVDARSADEYAAGHIAGAVSLPFDDVFHDPGLVGRTVHAGAQPVIAYCDGGDCDLSRNLAFTMIDQGLRKVLVYTGGLPAWRDAGGPVHTGARP